MSVKVQKYLLNVAKSVAYSTTDVLSEKFTYPRDFKNENREVFNEVYHSVKDYRTTFARLKKSITNNKIVDAARVGFDSIVYSVSTGDFYAKNKENEITEKYGGTLMADMDIDDDDFDFEKRDDVSEGDMVIATAVKKNSKIQTAITTEAIVKTGKAQMDVSKENAMLLYTQNERLINKLDGGLTNITAFLKQRDEETAKVQNKMNENINKFMTNVDNNVAKITAQLDEMLEMQRNMYKPVKPDEKKKEGYDDIIDRSGVINLKAYGSRVKKQAMDTLMETIPGLNMILGDGGPAGSNLLAMIAANPMRELSKTLINKALGKKFDAAVKDLNKTLENAIPDLMGRLVAEGRNEEGGFGKILGKILGIKSSQAENIDPNRYTKGAIPFDGMTKKAIIDVIPFYLRKMTSAMTGGEEMAFDFNTGRWTSMRAAKKQYDDLVNAERNQIADLLKKNLQIGTGRSFDSMYASADARNKADNAVKSLASRLSATGDFSSIKESELSSDERALWQAIKTIMRKDASRAEGDIWIDGKAGKNGTIRRQGASLSGFNSALRNIRNSSNSSIKQLNENGGLAMLAAMEGISGDFKDYHGKSYVDSNGDMSERRIQELPTAQVMLRAKDEYGKTLFNYLRDIGSNTRVTSAYSQYLQTLPFIYNNVGPRGGRGRGRGNAGNLPEIKIENILAGSGGDDKVDYSAAKGDKYALEYYKKLREKEKAKEKESYEKAVAAAKEKARKKGNSIAFINSTGEFRAENANETGISRIISDYEMDYEANAIEEDRKEKAKQENEKWKKREEILGKETTDKLRKADEEFDTTKGLRENMGKAKTTTEKLYMIAKWINQKTQVNAMDKISDTIIKTDAWLKNLLYGNSLKPDEEKLGLWQNIKNHTQKFFDWTKKTITEGIIEPIRKFYEDSWLQKGLRKIFGKVDSSGNIEEEGLLSHFTAGFRKGMQKNADDVRAIYKEEARKAKEAAQRAGLIDRDDSSSDTGSDSSSGGPSNPPPPSPGPTPRLNAEQQKQQQRIRTKRIAVDNAIKEYNKAKNKVNELEGRLQDKKDALASFDYYGDSSDINQYMRDYQAKQQLSQDISVLESQLVSAKSKMEQAKKKANKEILAYNNMLKQAGGMGIPNIGEPINTMATGGVNLTGRAFKSVLSAGEKVYTGTGVSKISHMGVYNIPNGAVVVNPASASTRAVQSAAEHKFARGLRYNAETDDGLTELTDEEKKKKEEEAKRKHEEAKKRIEQVDISKLTDWRTLSDDKQRAAFLGNMASRGLIGGVAGLLVGGPLLGAAVGAASSLSRSTDSFSEFIFGEVERDKDGDVILDNNGKPKRKVDSGLISKELQDAAPDMSKLGLVGLGAGLLTGLGPLGGLLIGSGLGFAKHTDAFQGTLFGDGGIFSDENVDKLKKGAKNMGIGAATAALFLPGPFGLVGSALIGATAGYVTSTDKFKDFLLGEEGEDGKRRGGVKGALVDNVVNPLKDFGRTIVDKTLDELFGPEGEDGERNTDEGLFGAIRANVIKPLTSGAQSIFKEITNTIVDIKDFTIDIFKKIKANAAGNDFIGGVWEKASKIGSNVIGLAGKAGRLATKPFRLIGDEGIGGRLKQKRIRRGRADDMTARERLKARGTFGMAAEDEWSGFDNLLIDLDAQGRRDLMTILDYDANSGDIDKARNSAYNVLGQELRKNISRKDTKKIIQMLKDGRAKDVERYLDRKNIEGDQRKNILKELTIHKNKMASAEEMYKDMKRKGITTQQYLQEHGVNVDISNPRKLKNLKLMLNREIAHDGVGLTEEELAWQEEKNFWSGAESPLKTVNAAASNMERMLEMIHYDLTLGDRYDTLSDKEKSKYGSKEDYINKTKNERVNNAIINAASNNKFSVGKYEKIGKLDMKSVKLADALTNDLWNDYLPLWTANLKDTMAPDDRLKSLISSEFDELIQTACEMFDGLALKELCVPERIKDDITKYTNRIAKRDKCSEEEARTKIKTMRRKITIVRNDKPYEFEMSYTIGADGSTVNPNKRQPNSYDNTKRVFIEDYMGDHKPKSFESSYMSFGDMISKSLSLGLYLRPIKLPGIPIINANVGGLVRDAFRTYGSKAIKSIPKLARKATFEISGFLKQNLGEHDLNSKSFLQERKNIVYAKEADLEWTKEWNKYKKAYELANRDHSVMSPEELEEFNYIELPKLKADMQLLDHITKSMGLGDEFGALDAYKQQQVRQRFVRMYIEAKQNGQLFGRGLIGNVKALGKRALNTKLGKGIKLAIGVNKILFHGGANEGENKEERKAKLIESLTKKAEYAWGRLFTVARDENGNPVKNKYDDNLGPYELEPKEQIVKLVHELYDSKYQEKTGSEALWSNLTKEERAMIHDTFISRFVQGRYNSLMEPLFQNVSNTLIDKARSWAYLKIKGIGDKAVDKITRTKQNIRNSIEERRLSMIKERVFKHALEHDMDTVNEIAVDKFSANYASLDDEQKLEVLNTYYSKYHKNTTLKGAFNISFKDKVGKMESVSKARSAVGALKSGVRNSVQGKLDTVKAWKEKQQERDNWMGRFFDIMDARKLRKDKEKFEGKKDSKIARILKWLFVGGVAVPLVVGFIKDDVVPAIKEKISPWLKKAKDKIFGVKDEKTGEYKGGIISGIVNPIRTFFKSKLEKVHNWIHNEGEFTSPDTGLKGFWKGLTKVGEHIIKLWKDGFTTVYGSFVPKVLVAVGKNMVPMLWNVGKGLLSYLKDFISGKQGAAEINLEGTGLLEMSQPSESTTIPSSAGGSIEVKSEGANINETIPAISTPGAKGQAKAQEDLLNRAMSTSNTTDKLGKSHTTYTSNKTGKSVTSKSDGDYYYAGQTKNGMNLYKDNKTNKTYIVNGNGEFVPASDYEEIANSNLTDNEIFQRQKELENANELSATHNTISAGTKMAGTTVKSMYRANNLRIIGGTNGMKAMAGAKGIVKAPTKPLRLLGWRSKSIGGALGAGIDVVDNASLKILPTQEKALTTFGEFIGKGGEVAVANEKKAATKAALKAAEKADKIAKKEALKAAEATKRANKLAKKAADGDVIAKVIQFIKDKKKLMKDKISKVLKNEKVAKFLGKSIPADKVDDVAEEVAESVVKATEGSADDIAKNSGKIAAKGAAKVLSIAMMVIDFFLGVDNCRNLLGISVKQPSFVERITGGLINIIPDVIMTLAEVITGASFGAAVGISAILAVLSFVATFLISIDKIRDFIVGKVIDVLERVGVDVSKIKSERADTKEAIENYNAANNTNLSISEYNKLIGNTTLASKVGGGIANAGSAVFGYDSATKKALKESTSGLEEKGKSDKVRKKLASIFSEIWQRYGDKHFNYAAYDEDGSKLSGKKKLNANQAKFNKCAENIMIGLNDILIQQDASVIKEVSSNASEYKGPLDARFNLKDTFYSGYDNPTSQFNVDEEHAEWKRIKAIAGICAIMNDIFKPCGCMAEITKTVVQTMMPAYFSVEELQKIGDVTNEVNSKSETSEAKYNLNTDSIDGDTTNNAVTEDTGFVGPTLPTNANTNDKLTPIRGIKNRFNIQTSISDTINNAIASITGGGFMGISEIIKSLHEKNKQINKKIDALRLLPTDDEYWKIEMDEKHPFASSLFSFTENISRVIKAPFSLAASMNMSTAKILSSNVNTTSTSSGSTTSTASTSGNTSNAKSSNNQASSTATTTKSNSKSVLGKLWSGIKSGLKSLFGKGKGDSDETDPYHIYQRDFSDGYNTSGDSEHQSLADSGCGPASAATVLRMYGREGSMKNAANFALRNKYKEKDGGTYPEYFSHYLSNNGISTNANATNEDVVRSLAYGKPVILMGRNIHGDKNTPYGNKYSHYVVARGIDRNGNVIIEDSEDKKGNTRYSLSDTLKNTSVRITTGSGKYGRANDNMSVNDRYISNVNAVISGTVGSVIAAAINGANINTGTVTTGKQELSGNVSGDAKAALGKSLTMSDGKGNTHTIKITEDEVDLYSMLTGDCGLSAAAACGAIGNWEQECGINSIREIATKGVIYYGGGLMQWTPGDKHTTWAAQNGYGSDPWSWEANLAHAKDEIMTGGNWSNPKNADPSFESEGLKPVSSFAEFKTLSDPESAAANFERVFEVSGDWNGRNSEGVVYKANMIHDNLRRLNAKILYELIVNGKEGTDTTGKGRYGRSKFGRAGDEEEKKLLNKEIVDASTMGPLKENQVRDGTEEAKAVKAAKAEATEDKLDGKKKDTSVSSEQTKGLINLLGKYVKKLTKGVYGNFYDALYGSEPVTTSSTTSSSSSDSVTPNVNFSIDAETTIICGDSITNGLHIASPLKDRALGLGSGTTDKNNDTPFGTYTTVFKNNADIIKKATDVIFFWGMNEVKCGLSKDAYFKRYQDSIDTILGYAGKKASDVNICIMPVIAVPKGAVYTSTEVENFNKDFIQAFADSKGYPFIDIYEDSKQVPHSGNDVHPSDYNVLYEIIKAHTGGGTGRGLAKSILHKYAKGKYGRSIWGRDGEEETTTTDTAAITETTSDTTTTAESTTTKKSSSSGTTNAKSLISKLATYSKKAIKGVYGNFYDALYGSEPTSTDSDSTSSSYNGDDVLYAAAMVAEAMGKANPSYIYDAWGGHYFDLECRDGTILEHERPDCSGLMSAIMHYMGYYTVRPGVNTAMGSGNYHGEGWGTQAWDEGRVRENTCIFDSDGKLSEDWVIIDFDPNDMKPGDIRLMQGHTNMYVYTDSNGSARGYNGGSPSGFKESETLGIHYLDNNGDFGNLGDYIDDSRPTLGIIRYVGKHGSGRGKSIKDKVSTTRSVKSNIGFKKKASHTLGDDWFGSTNIHYGRGYSLPDLTSHGLTSTTGHGKSKNSSYGRGYYDGGTTNNTTYNRNTTDLTELITLITTIANNSEKMDSLLTILGAIAVNTENTSNNTKSTTQSTNKPDTPKNGLAALRNALTSNDNGQDIINAIYQIAKS